MLHWNQPAEHLRCIIKWDIFQVENISVLLVHFILHIIPFSIILLICTLSEYIFISAFYFTHNLINFIIFSSYVKHLIRMTSVWMHYTYKHSICKPLTNSYTTYSQASRFANGSHEGKLEEEENLKPNSTTVYSSGLQFCLHTEWNIISCRLTLCNKRPEQEVAILSFSSSL